MQRKWRPMRRPQARGPSSAHAQPRGPGWTRPSYAGPPGTEGVGGGASRLASRGRELVAAALRCRGSLRAGSEVWTSGYA